MCSPTSRGFLTATFAVLLISGTGLGRATAQVFTIDPGQSSVTISGTVIGGTITDQGPKSLTASVQGTLQATLVGNKIQFTGESQILAQTNGSWQPKADGTAGAEPADFGGQANLGIASGVAALRNIQLDVVSPALTINGGHFDSTSLTFLFPSNALSSLAYNVTGLITKHGSAPLTGYATNKVTALGSLTATGTGQLLKIPVDATFYLQLLSANDTIIRLQGQLVAAQKDQAPLQVQSIAVNNQSLQLQWQASPGQQFQIQSSPDLMSWTNAATLVTPASGSYTWTGQISAPVGFFRLAK